MLTRNFFAVAIFLVIFPSCRTLPSISGRHRYTDVTSQRIHYELIITSVELTKYDIVLFGLRLSPDGSIADSKATTIGNSRDPSVS